jgi:hypothetical protein
MSSNLARKLIYVKDRCINAYWMLRTGKFKLILKSIHIEISHRIGELKTWLEKGEELDDTQIPGSAYVNRRKVLPPSYRPTDSRLSAPGPMRSDPVVVANELKRILQAVSIKDNNHS